MSGKINYHHRLYVGNSISASKLNKLKKRLEKTPHLCDAYLITISRNPSDQLEFFTAKQLVQKYYSQYPVYVIGIASDYEEAMTLIEKIVQECLQSRRDCALKEYLSC